MYVCTYVVSYCFSQDEEDNLDPHDPAASQELEQSPKELFPVLPVDTAPETVTPIADDVIIPEESPDKS